jgi:alpha-1,3-rhamnosyl/mannosyltransferase
VILLDARMVGPRRHGIARYAEGLVPALRRAAPEQDFTALVAPDLPPGSPIATGACVATRIPLYTIREQLQIPALLGRVRPALLHSLTYAAPLRCPVPAIPTIHDLIHLTFAGPRLALYRAYYAAVVGPAARRAPRVITGSEARAAEIAERLRVPRERIAVTPIAAGPAFFAAGDADAQRARARYRLGEPFLLYVGNERPHKNLAGALRMHAAVRREHRVDLPLAVAGVPPHAVANATGARVVVLGDVPDADLPGLYRAAAALVMPSLDEGFGLPALEALAAGAVVIAARRGGLPEVVGNAALLEDPSDEAAFAAAIARAVCDASLAARLRQSGRERAGLFDWERTAEATLQIYRDAT